MLSRPSRTGMCINCLTAILTQERAVRDERIKAEYAAGATADCLAERYDLSISRITTIAREHIRAKQARREVMITDIIATASELSKVTVDEIKGRRRWRRISLVRQAVYLVARNEGYPSPQIGRIIGNRDHSTVVDGIQACEGRMRCDPEYAAFVETLGREARSRPRFLPSSVIAEPPPPPIMPCPVEAEDFDENEDFDEIEYLSRKVAQHYARAA